MPDVCTPPTHSPNQDIFKSDEESRAFRWFESTTKKQLVGFHARSFWDRDILQASHTNPGIRHAVIALGAVHRAYQNGDEACLERGEFALKQYNLAIRQHLDSLKTSDGLESRQAYLASCMVFTCIEVEIPRHFAVRYVH